MLSRAGKDSDLIVSHSGLGRTFSNTRLVESLQVAMEKFLVKESFVTSLDHNYSKHKTLCFPEYITY